MTQGRKSRVRMTVTIFGVFVLEYSDIPDAIFISFPWKARKIEFQSWKTDSHCVPDRSAFLNTRAQPLLLLKVCISTQSILLNIISSYGPKCYLTF